MTNDITTLVSDMLVAAEKSQWGQEGECPCCVNQKYQGHDRKCDLAKAIAKTREFLALADKVRHDTLER